MRSLVQRKKIYQAFGCTGDTRYQSQLTVGFGIFMGFLDLLGKYRILPDLNLSAHLPLCKI